MYINDEIKRHFFPDKNGRMVKKSVVIQKANIPGWKLRYFLYKGGNLYTDELIRLMIALGYEIHSPEGDLIYGGEDNQEQHILENTPK